MEYVTEEEIEERNQNAQNVTASTPYYSIILIVCIVVVTFAQMATDLNQSVEIAGFEKPSFLGGEYWRILTSAALHGSIMHLGFNAYALYVLGRMIEMLSNRAHLAVVFFISIIGGNLLGLAFGPNVLSIGASGGVIGFLGYLTVYGYKRRKLLSHAFLKNMLINVVIIAVFGLFIMPNVDNFAHLGGFLVGAVYGFVQIPNDLHKDPREIDGATNVIGLVSLGAFILTSIFSTLLITKVISFS